MKAQATTIPMTSPLEWPSPNTIKDMTLLNGMDYERKHARIEQRDQKVRELCCA
jgi:hypothetical protein